MTFLQPSPLTSPRATVLVIHLQHGLWTMHFMFIKDCPPVLPSHTNFSSAAYDSNRHILCFVIALRAPPGSIRHCKPWRQILIMWSGQNGHLNKALVTEQKNDLFLSGSLFLLTMWLKKYIAPSKSSSMFLSESRCHVQNGGEMCLKDAFEYKDCIGRRFVSLLNRSDFETKLNVWLIKFFLNSSSSTKI